MTKLKKLASSHTRAEIAPAPPTTPRKTGFLSQGFGVLSSLRNVVVENVKSVACTAVPTIVGQVVQTAMSDPVLGKIVGGIGCTLGGGCLLLASGAVHAVKAAICRRKPAQAMTVGRVATAAAGALLMSYGVSNIISGLHSLQQGDQAEAHCREIQSREQAFFDCNGTLPEYRQSRADVRSAAALEARMRACPAVNEQWKLVECEGPFSLKHVSAEEAPSGGAWQTCGRSILVSRDHVPEDFRLKSALFELSNAENDRHLRELVLDTRAGKYGKQEYAKEFFRIEWETQKRSHELGKTCTKSQGWNPQVAESRYGGITTFDEAWKKYSNDPANKKHRQIYLDQWDAALKDDFCMQKPLHPDCA